MLDDVGGLTIFIVHGKTADRPTWSWRSVIHLYRHVDLEYSITHYDEAPEDFVQVCSRSTKALVEPRDDKVIHSSNAAASSWPNQRGLPHKEPCIMQGLEELI